MTKNEAVTIIKAYKSNLTNSVSNLLDGDIEALEMAIKALEQEPCEDAISRKALISLIENQSRVWGEDYDAQQILGDIEDFPPVNPQAKTGHCKDCKYFEYDSVAKVNGIPLIMAHEICKKWGDGCKTKEDGYCFLFEPQERSE